MYAKSGSRVGRFLGSKSLHPFIYKGKEVGHFEPSQYVMGKQIEDAERILENGGTPKKKPRKKRNA